ncbi:hypothetical protein N8I71_12515 [Roseibacterium sp. SDUM158016]|uniref:hypothetical protein n=1 Tax=Roseicyclus sediminis TaxID=2980997 RepID=UPI0021D1610C|nr:hypothetical protein [Roseibacterium sp. SDUM158016]MCU4653659.1 hypothetical protein [Roseibacterium sp. SDUM158016]
MAEKNFRMRGQGFIRSEAGSGGISSALFVIALVCAGIVAILGAIGVVKAPLLVYLVFGVIVLAAGWDAPRERRKGGGR